jgi:hypothetical protein
MRIWLQKQKKKEEAKAAAAAATPPAETTPAAAEVQPAGDGADKPVDSIEVVPKVEDASVEPALENAGDAERAGSTAAPANKVGLRFLISSLFPCASMTPVITSKRRTDTSSGSPKRIMTISLLHVHVALECMSHLVLLLISCRTLRHLRMIMVTAALA